MKKINFSDRYRLTQAVLEGRKTMTRRIITCPREFKGKWVAGFYVYKRMSDNAIINWPCMYDDNESAFDEGEILPKYKIGEVVAIAQRYSEIGIDPFPFCEAGWNNKMFVRSDLMPHHIRITDVRVERLQDISDEDCLKEGVVQKFDADGTPRYRVPWEKHTWAYATDSAKDAYHFLIDKVYGKATWESNPYVFVYEFELVD